jgi:hypothetical protein
MTKEQIAILSCLKSLKNTTDIEDEAGDERRKDKIDHMTEQCIADIFRQKAKKTRANQRSIRLILTLVSGLPFLLFIENPAYLGFAMLFLPCAWPLNSYLCAQGKFSESTTNRMCVLFPMTISMWLLFADQGSSWRSYAIPLFIDILVYLMPKNFFTHDLRQPPSTWKKWE